MACTVGEMAELIRRKDQEGWRGLSERLRNYTKEGLLDPTGEKHPGSGRERLFSDDMIIRAAILNALQDAGILPTTAMKILRRCPDLTIGKVTIRLSDTVSIVIDGPSIAKSIKR